MKLFLTVCEHLHLQNRCSALRLNASLVDLGECVDEVLKALTCLARNRQLLLELIWQKSNRKTNSPFSASIYSILVLAAVSSS